MAEAEGIPPTASTVVPGLSLNYIGEHVFAYAGTQAVSSGVVTALSFTTGNNYLLVDVEISFDITGLGTGEDIGYQIKLNGNEVVDHDLGSNIGNPQWILLPTKLLLPPFTFFEGILSTSDASDINMGMTLTGRVYDA